MNIKKPKFQPRYKYIRCEKQLDMNKFIADINFVPFSTVYAIDDPNEKLSIFNDLLLDCINQHAPLKRTKFTRPPAPWMRDNAVVSSWIELTNLRNLLKSGNCSIDEYRKARNAYKKTIRLSKSRFLKKSLSSKSSKDIWKTVKKLIKPQYRRMQQHPDELNQYFATLVANLTTVSKLLELREL